MKRLTIVLGIIILGLIGGYTFSENSQHLVSAGIEERYEDLVEEKEDILEESINRVETQEEVQDDEETNEMEDFIEGSEDEGKKSVDKWDSSHGGTSAKKVFLTFDDGPTSLTPEILRILKENGVEATFFVIGKLAENNPDIITRTYLEGHMVLPHSYTHDYAIYSTFETFYEDFYRAEAVVNDILGIEVPPIFRFPGGSSNQSSFRYGGRQFMPKLTVDVKEKGYYYVDWNVSSGDAGPDYNNKNKMLDNVINGAKNKDLAVVLFHDVARNTRVAEILPEIIQSFKEQGYEFRTFRDITEEELNKMIQLKISNKPIVR